MAPVASQPTCLLSIGKETPELKDWEKSFKEWIAAVGFNVRDYSAVAVGASGCLLAYPQEQDDLVYQVAYSMGSGLKVLLLVEEDVSPRTYDPPPTLTVSIQMRTQLGREEAERKIKDALEELKLLSNVDSPRQDIRLPASVTGTAQEPLLLTSIEQAEQQFQTFLADGMSQESIRRLLAEAGARQSWLDFRIQRHFGGW